MAKVAFKEADVRRAFKASLEAILRAGLSPADFKIIHKDGETTLLPANASDPLSENEDLEKRMREAFGG